jgi:hypothetical protein
VAEISEVLGEVGVGLRAAKEEGFESSSVSVSGYFRGNQRK